jgi:hypothetical protein
MKCLNCETDLVGKQTKYCSKKCKQYFLLTLTRNIHKSKTGLSLQSNKGILRKLLFIEEFGGSCTKCGYNKNISALEFHHVEPSDKLFTLDLRNLSNRNIDIIRTELKKCVLLCSNCHQELHYPHLDMKNIVK